MVGRSWAINSKNATNAHIATALIRIANERVPSVGRILREVMAMAAERAAAVISKAV